MIIDGVNIPDEKLIELGWNPPPKRGRQRKIVEKGKKYYIIDESGVLVTSYSGVFDTTDNRRFERGNYFLTKAEAKHNEAVRCAGVRILDALREAEGNCEPVNWEKQRVDNYAIWFNYELGLFCVNSYKYRQCTSPEWYTTSAEAWCAVVQSHKADLKLRFGVTKAA